MKKKEEIKETILVNEINKKKMIKRQVSKYDRTANKIQLTLP